MTDIIQDMLVEFDGAGKPTGNALFQGVKYTGVTQADVGALPPFGRTTDKAWVVHRVVFSDTINQPPTHVFERLKNTKKSISWSKA